MARVIPALRASGLSELPRRSPTYSAGRVCASEDCRTLLSIYNRSTFCWLHEPAHVYRVRGRRKRREAA
jgi:hypothetical protein